MAARPEGHEETRPALQPDPRQAYLDEGAMEVSKKRGGFNCRPDGDPTGVASSKKPSRL